MMQFKPRHGAGLVFSAALAAMLATGGAQAQDTVKFGTATTSLIVAPLLLADIQPDILAAHDIQMELTDFRGNTENCMTAMITGQTDLCLSNPVSAANAMAEGADIKIFGAMARPINEIVLSKKAADATGVAPDAPIGERIRALKGLRLSTAGPGTAHYMVLKGMLETEGMSMEDITFQTLVDAPAMIASIQNDRLDGSLWSAGTLGVLLQDGSGVRWVSFPRGDVPAMADVPYIVLVARTEWLEQNEDLAERLRAALGDAAKAVLDDPAATGAEIKAKYFPDLDAGVWEDAYDQATTAFFTDSKVSREGWTLLMDMVTESGDKDYTAASYENGVAATARAD